MNLKTKNQAELLEMVNNLELEILKRIKRKRKMSTEPQIPKMIKDYISTNKNLFEGDIDIDDIDVCYVCKDMNTKELIIYSGICIYDNGAYILEWELKNNKATLHLNGELLLDVKNTYSLNYKDIEYK